METAPCRYQQASGDLSRPVHRSFEKGVLGTSRASEVPTAAKASASERLMGKAGMSGWGLPAQNS